MRVLVTRAEPAASRTAQRLAEMGHEAICLPLFELQDSDEPTPNETFDGYIFTSGNACEVLKRRGWQAPDADASAFCVGKRTAEAARLLGFESAVHADGGAEKLMPLIREHFASGNPRVLYFTTPDRSFDVAGALSAHGISVTNLEIYRMQRAGAVSGSLQSLIESRKPDIVLSYSAGSAQALADILKLDKAETLATSMILVAISEAAAAPLAHLSWSETRIAPVANEQAMLHILQGGQAGPE